MTRSMSLFSLATLFLSACSTQQVSPPIRGTVTFADTNEPAPSATVIVYRGSFTSETRTDSKGRYIIPPHFATIRSPLFRGQWPPLVLSAWQPFSLPETTWIESGSVPGLDPTHDPFAVSEPKTVNFKLKVYGPNGY